MVSPTKRSARVGLAPAYSRTDRRARRPQHRFNLVFRPYQIQPFAIAPVLPGESLKNALIQAQVWSDPLATGLKNTGWWIECFLFYVKHRDLVGYEVAADGLGKDLIDMFVTGESLAAHKAVADVVKTYTPKGGVDFTQSALERIVEEYFREEGERWNDWTVDGLPLAKVYGRGQDDAFEHLTNAAAYADRRQRLDVDADGNIYVDEVEKAYSEWAAAHDAGLVDMDYEDWMRTYGGSTGLTATPDHPDLHRPELLGHVREFSYPTNTVEPTTGVPAVAVGWRVGSRLGKAFFFPEPGWIIGLVVIRPKMYMGNQKGSVASMMLTRETWLPAVMNENLNVSHLLVNEAEGPLHAIMATDYWLDLRDLLNNGDQFMNTAPSGATGFAAELPAANGQHRYVGSVDIDQLFKDTSAGVGKFNGDGVLSLTILGRQQPRYENLVLGRA